MLVTKDSVRHSSMTQNLISPASGAPHNITIIEWEMLDKKKFFPLSMMSSFTVRCFLYPLTLIRTRLQVRVKNILVGFKVHQMRRD